MTDAIGEIEDRDEHTCWRCKSACGCAASYDDCAGCLECHFERDCGRDCDAHGYSPSEDWV